MAKAPEKTSRDKHGSAKDSPRAKSSPMTDYHDASEPLHPASFGEAPQAEFTGAHLYHLAAAGCVLNDVHREAQRLGIAVDKPKVFPGDRRRSL